MKAAQISQYGGSEVFTVTDDAPKPMIASDQVLVEVRAAAVNPFDIMVREGHAKQMAELSFPAVLGGDLAGVVSEIGEDVSGFSVGQEVFGMANALSSHGSFAELVPVKASSLAPKPVSVDFESAAALPLASVSAYQALVDHMQLQSGQKILIHGGAGGIGSQAIQIAKQLGAFVATTAGPGDVEYVQSLGASEVIDYTTQDFAQLLDEYDAVFDTVGGETNAKSYVILKAGGAFVSMRQDGDEAKVADKQLRYIHEYTQVTTERLNKIAEMVDAGTLKVTVDKTFPLAEIAAALEYQANGHPKGKVVIAIS